MIRALLLRSLLDGMLLLVSCCATLIVFLAFRVWVASQIDFGALQAFFVTGLPQFVAKLLPVPIEVLATPAGRIAFGYEEFPVIVLAGLWTFARGTECLAGRLENGTMEMLLSQPVGRLTILGTHTAVTLAGCVALGLAGWLGTVLGIVVSSFQQVPEWRRFAPASFNLIGLSVFCVGLATLISALVGTRGRAVGVAIGIYVFQLTLMIVAMLAPRFAWMRWTTILTAYDPTALTVGLINEPELHTALFWQYNTLLYGLGLLGLCGAAVVFCRRDVPAPL